MEAQTQTQSERVWVEDLAEQGGAKNATVRGIIIDVKEGSGLAYRCPECKRVLRKMACRIHGQVQGVPDLRVKAVVDDGSGAMVAVFNRQLTEGLLKKTLDACVAESKDNQDVIRDQIADMLVAQPVEVRGDVTSDDYGLMMVVDAARVLKVDLAEEAKAIVAETDWSELSEAAKTYTRVAKKYAEAGGDAQGFDGQWTEAIEKAEEEVGEPWP